MNPNKRDQINEVTAVWTAVYEKYLDQTGSKARAFELTETHINEWLERKGIDNENRD